MFGIPILIQDQMPLHARRARHPYPAQRMCPSGPAYFHGSFPDMIPSSSMQPVWMFQPDAFPCSPSQRPCSQQDVFPFFTSLRNCGSSCAPQPDAPPSSTKERPAPEQKQQEPSDFAQKVMSDLFRDILCTDKEEVLKERKEQKSRKQNMSRQNANNCSRQKSKKNQVLTDFLIDTLKGLCGPQSQKTQTWTHLVDCSGLKSEDIYVKVQEGCIIVRGETEEHGEDGTMSVTSIEKRIKLPQNLQAKKVSCRLLPNSKLLIEAPYISQRKAGSSTSCNEEDKSALEDKPREATLSKTEGGEKSDKASDTILESEVTNNDDEVDDEDTEVGNNDEDNSDEDDDDVDNNDEDNSDEDDDDEVDNNDKDNDDDDAQSQTSTKTEESFVVVSSGNEKKEQEVSVSDQPNNDEDGDIVSPDHFHQHHEISHDNSSEIDDNSATTETELVPIASSLPTVSNKHDEATAAVLQATIKQNDDIETPAAAVTHTKEFQVRLEMTSHNPESIRVTMDDATRHVTIHARKDNNNGNSSESVHKEVRVPENVDVTQLRCRFQDGLLTVTAPFMAPQEVTGTPRVIPVHM